eukprot:m.170022 g.170022  ORF g.170022 m.170022 type:complete len:144 (-) comp24185_c0_seq1:607-1038(-)
MIHLARHCGRGGGLRLYGRLHRLELASPFLVTTKVSRQASSVSSIVYPRDRTQHSTLPVVDVYTTAGCTLCDVAVEVLRSTRQTVPHVLRLQDITDPQHRGVFREMKNEIPVLWINGQYWTKHRITTEEAILALQRVQGEVPT